MSTISQLGYLLYFIYIITLIFYNEVFNNYTLCLLQASILPVSGISKAYKKSLNNKDKFFSIKPPVKFLDKYSNHNHSSRKIIKQKYNKVTGIYLWVNTITNRSYVGKSVNLHQRITKYFSAAYINNNKSKMAICGSISKYGINNFTLYILEVINSDNSKKFLSERENYWYNYINPSYNIQSILQPFSGNNHYRFGSVVPELVKSKISNTLKGRVRTQSTKDHHILGAHKKPVYCYEFKTRKYLMEFSGMRIMARSLNKKYSNYIRYYLDNDKLFNCTIDNINYKMILRSSKICNDNN
jgi:hypothetical protein